jgi:MFS family permease
MAHTTTRMIVLRACFGIAADGVLPTANAVVATQTAAQLRGAVYGFTAAATAIGGFIGPIGGAAVAARFDVRYVFVISDVLMIAAGLWVLQAIRPGTALTADGV